jgi:hypothetical protein
MTVRSLPAGAAAVASKRQPASVPRGSTSVIGPNVPARVCPAGRRRTVIVREESRSGPPDRTATAMLCERCTRGIDASFEPAVVGEAEGVRVVNAVGVTIKPVAPATVTAVEIARPPARTTPVNSAPNDRGERSTRPTRAVIPIVIGVAGRTLSNSPRPTRGGQTRRAQARRAISDQDRRRLRLVDRIVRALNVELRNNPIQPSRQPPVGASEQMHQ